MLRLSALAVLLASPANAWEFSPSPLCTLQQAGPIAVTLTYDPMLPEYVLTVTADTVWPTDLPFFMTFAGWRPDRIQTDRQTLSEDGRSLSVRDSGFGNVLDGMEFGALSQAGVGDQVVTMPTDGISGPMKAFRVCETAALS